MSLPYTNRTDTRFLTDIPASWPGSAWTRSTTFAPPPAWLWRGAQSRRPLVARVCQHLLPLVWGLRLYRARRRFACAVTTGAGAGMVFAVLQSLLPFSRLPHVMIDCLWYRERTWWRRWLARIKFRLIARSVSACVVWASVEVEAYAAAFAIPREKLVFLPFHHTLEQYQYEIGDQGYIFAGGDGDRDYATLLTAARAVEAPFLIATRRPLPSSPPPNVTVRAMTAEAFRQAMAQAQLVVVPMTPGLAHIGGQQTYLNAMAMGKAVIVGDDRGAPDYIRDGVTGRLLPAGDADALTHALRHLLHDPEARTAMGQQAAAEIHTRELTTDGCMRRVVMFTEALLTGHSPHTAVSFLSGNPPVAK